jgi:hypothetical protein
MNITYLNNPIENMRIENARQAKEPFTVNVTDKCTYRLIPAGLIKVSVTSFKKCINQLAKIADAEQYINAVEKIVYALLASNYEIIHKGHGESLQGYYGVKRIPKEKALQHNSKIMIALMQASDKYASWMREAF